MNKLSLSSCTSCLLGGAIGDALGAPIEFMSINQIRKVFGSQGITGYVEYAGDRGAFTDDTQMTLFTAEGLLRAYQRGTLRGIANISVVTCTYKAYLLWLRTQSESFRPDADDGWLIQQKELFNCRAPGNSCLSALTSGKMGTMKEPVNDSKGCGGIMRMAPVGLVFAGDPKRAFRLGCELAAITHGHPSGYLSAGFFASLIALLVTGESLENAIAQSIRSLEGYPEHKETLSAVNKALKFAQTAECTPENIERLGGGWVGEEALAIALYCSLCFPNDFEKGVLASVNHSGDSDSTGSITGNIAGLMLSDKNIIPQRWIENLLYKEIVLQIAEDLHTGITVSDLY
ncbi:MAG: ADP-ribosylglycohydrolase family protein [Paludibacter sp.]|jgi:ADP-ribosylglycohydrolase|nr:ADP-ribosylglycohydrolase family protein [Paludibacter sp.]